MALDRRQFLLGAGGAVVLAACGDDGGGANPTTAPPTTAAASVVLGEAFDRNRQVLAGIPQRVTYVLFDPDGGEAAAQPDELAFRIVDATGAVIGDGVTAPRHAEGLPRSYYPVTFTWPEPGLYTTVTEVGGEVLQSPLQANGRDVVTVGQPGDPLPALVTPTTADPLGVATLCTRQPACPFHETTPAAALAAGQPLTLMVSTPAFCQTAICGPVLDLLVEAAPRHPDVAVVHLEVYPNGLDAGPTDLVQEGLGLEWEPALFVTAADGTISTRLDNVFDVAELEAALVR